MPGSAFSLYISFAQSGIVVSDEWLYFISSWLNENWKKVKKVKSKKTLFREEIEMCIKRISMIKVRKNKINETLRLIKDHKLKGKKVKVDVALAMVSS